MCQELREHRRRVFNPEGGLKGFQEEVTSELIPEGCLHQLQRGREAHRGTVCPKEVASPFSLARLMLLKGTAVSFH